MSNLLKSAYVVQKENNERLIDSNSLIAKRIDDLTKILEAQENDYYGDDGDGFVEGLNAEQVESLLSDPDAAESVNSELQSQIDAAREELDSLRGQASHLIEDARAQADAIISDANEQAQQIMADAESQGHDNGYNTGYKEGLQKAKEAEDKFKDRKAQLEEEYANKLSSMEEDLVETICKVYERVFAADMSGRTDVVMHLLGRALESIEGGTNYLVHVSDKDYDYASEHKDELVAGLGSTSTLEIISDRTLGEGCAYIETESGIYDCSFGVEMESLNKELKLLASDI